MPVRHQAPELVAPLNLEIGENPLWHAEAATLYFIDIFGGTVHAYIPATESYQQVCKTHVTGGFTIQEDGSLLLFQDGRLSLMSLNGSVREVASGLCPHNQRFNDVIADPEGRVYAGAMDGGPGHLYRFDLDGSVTEILSGLGIPNGIGFTPDLTGMYFTDSVPHKIYHFDYDRKTGELSNQRVFVQIPQEQGLPDGMTVDAEGYVWSAIWYGSGVKRFAPDGRLDQEILIPANQTASVTFGGPNLSDLYISTSASAAADSMKPAGLDPNLFKGGGLYRIRLEGIQGRPAFRSRLRFS
jgi:D-xylono/L-arabinono-1,4-lactonase